MQMKDPAKGRRPRTFLQGCRARGRPSVSGKVHSLDLYGGGEWFDARRRHRKGRQELHQAVLGEGIAREIGKDSRPPLLKVGDASRWPITDWVVTGVMNSAGSTFDSEIWAKRRVGQATSIGNKVNHVNLRVAHRGRRQRARGR